MLKLEFRDYDYARKSDGVKVKNREYFVEFVINSASGKEEFKYKHVIKLDDRNWKEMLNAHIGTASVVMTPREYVKNGETVSYYQPQIKFFVEKTPFYIDFNLFFNLHDFEFMG